MDLQDGPAPVQDIHEPGENTMDLNLLLCYVSIFDGLPLEELVGWRGFLDAHARHEPPIETVYDFGDHAADVLTMFYANDFAREYAERRAGDPVRFPGVPAQLSSAGITDRLRAMRATIIVLGREAVTANIVQLFEEHGERPPTNDPDIFYRLLLEYLCQQRVPQRGRCLPAARARCKPPFRKGSVYTLLARLRGLA
jgi:hypothetical protein